MSIKNLFTITIMKMMSRIRWSSVLVASFFFLWSVSFISAAEVDPWTSVFISQTDNGAAWDVNTVGTDTQQKDAVINIVKSAVNRVLWILALIALLVLLYGWFLMVTSVWNEEQYGKWFTILKHAAVGIALIGIARFIVSILFRLINLFTTTAEGSDAQTAS
jgi:hypothetical protein